eukprot:COSAG01_NODE_44849_length_415_cov_0.601266_1_plen_114_part_10
MYAGCSVPLRLGLQRRHLEVECAQRDKYVQECVSPLAPARPLHRAFACPHAPRLLRMGIMMGESGARTRGPGRFRLSLGLGRACVRAVQCSARSGEPTSELQAHYSVSYAVFCL